MPKKASTSPTQRTLKHLKDQGFRCAIVEKYNSFINIRQDMFGIIDIVALTPTGVMGVQSTGQDFYGHRSAMMKEKRQDCIDWLNTPGTRLVLYGWDKKNKKGRSWVPKIQELFIGDFSGYELNFGVRTP